jgi:CDP-diglyceride synthetase
VPDQLIANDLPLTLVLVTSLWLLGITGVPMAIWTFFTNSKSSRVFAGRWFTWMLVLASGGFLVLFEQDFGDGYFVGYLVFWSIIWARGMYETVRLAYGPTGAALAGSRSWLGFKPRTLVAAAWMIALTLGSWLLTNLGSQAFVLFFVVALFDIGGWLGGNTLARIKPFGFRIFPKTSPNKTLGGLLISVVLGATAWWWVYSGFGNFGITPPVDLIGFAILATFAVFGDWFESKLKRLAGVKDAGTIVPGFGGVLDRFDSIIWVGVGSLLISYF